MTLVVENGTGKVDANSYAAVDDADKYFSDRGVAAWDALDESVKEQLLIKATDYIDATFAGQWKGYKLSDTQALDWPRARYSYPPRGVVTACIELALIANITELMPTVTRGKKVVKVGLLEVQYDGNSPVATDFTKASLRIAPYLNNFGAEDGGINTRAVRT